MEEANLRLLAVGCLIAATDISGLNAEERVNLVGCPIARNRDELPDHDKSLVGPNHGRLATLVLSAMMGVPIAHSGILNG
jgi:hypothetical protein